MTFLEMAMKYWQRGQPAPLDIAVELMEQGMDVNTLERKHRRDPNHPLTEVSQNGEV